MANNKIDVLYILGSGSPFKNEELRYSLRSLEKHARNIGQVKVVGEDPGFLIQEVFHKIPEAPGNKESRIASKILAACEQGIVTGNFLFCNDDFLFHKDFDAAKYPFYYRGGLPSVRAVGHYRRSLFNTYMYLHKRRLPTKHFDVHNPIIYNAAKFRNLKPHWRASSELYEGMVVKSLYANLYGITGTRRSDAKISNYKMQQTRVAGREVFSYSDAGWRHGVKEYAMRLFPEPSRWEMTN